VKKEVAQSAFRLLGSFDWFEGFSRNSGPHNARFEQEVNVYYTDGSRTDAQTGIGIYGSSVRNFETLSSTPTIYLAEVNAINVCAKMCLEYEGNDNKQIFIMSDSLSGYSEITHQLANKG
jgi:hypothetical protein